MFIFIFLLASKYKYGTISACLCIGDLFDFLLNNFLGWMVGAWPQLFDFFLLSNTCGWLVGAWSQTEEDTFFFYQKACSLDV